MNHSPSNPLSFSTAAADAFGKAIALRLSQNTGELPHAVSERLKAARALAVAQRKMVSTRQSTAAVSVSGGAMGLQIGSATGGWLPRLASLLPLLALLAGLHCIDQWQDEKRALELAEVDAELLLDDLPPQAYADPGFLQFLRINSAP
ncbi:MAG: DUF3619 family protein [Rhodoferax sp.]|nr:DUF3619 family protein [Rhodoferax sp.]